jgi:hypothetical protein
MPAPGVPIHYSPSLCEGRGQSKRSRERDCSELINIFSLVSERSINYHESLGILARDSHAADPPCSCWPSTEVPASSSSQWPRLPAYTERNALPYQTC